MSKQIVRRGSRVKRKLNLADEAETIPIVGNQKISKNSALSTAVEITMQVGTRQPQPGKNNKQTQLIKNKTRAKPKSNKESLNSENNNAIPGAIKQQEVPSKSGVGQSKTVDGKQANNVKPSSRLKQKEIADEASKQEETVYEWLYKKVQENRAARGLTMTNNHQEGDHLNQSFDGIQVNVDASDDDFMESDDELDDITRLSGRQSQESQCNQNSIAVNCNEPSTSTTKEDKFRAWRNDPDFKDFVTEVWTNMNEKNASTGKDKGNNRRKVVKLTIPHKSPSDTTIYKFCRRCSYWFRDSEGSYTPANAGAA